MLCRVFREHLTNSQKVLRRLKLCGVKLTNVFFKQEVRYLARLISRDDYRPNPKDTEDLEKLRCLPKTIGGIAKSTWLSWLLSLLENFQKY